MLQTSLLLMKSLNKTETPIFLSVDLNIDSQPTLISINVGKQLPVL